MVWNVFCRCSFAERASANVLEGPVVIQAYALQFDISGLFQFFTLFSFQWRKIKMHQDCFVTGLNKAEMTEALLVDVYEQT